MIRTQFTGLCSAFLLFFWLVFPVSAAPVQFSFETTFISTDIPGTVVGGTFSLEVIADNGGTSLINQIWTHSDVTSAFATSGSYNANLVPPPSTSTFFQSDGIGELSVARFTDFDSNNVDIFGAGAKVHSNAMQASSQVDLGFFADTTDTVSAWSISPVPLPPAVALMGLAVAGLSLQRRIDADILRGTNPRTAGF